MRLDAPHIRAQRVHVVTIGVKDGPDLPAVRGRDGYHRHRIDQLTIRYIDGDLVEVRTTGTRLTAGGAEHARGDGQDIVWLTRDPRRSPWQDVSGTLREETPDWIREAVAAHPWVDPSLEKAAVTVTRWAERAAQLGDTEGEVQLDKTAGWLRKWARLSLDADWSTEP